MDERKKNVVLQKFTALMLATSMIFSGGPLQAYASSLSDEELNKESVLYSEKVDTENNVETEDNTSQDDAETKNYTLQDGVLTINEGVEEIHDHEFQNKGIKEVYLPASVKYIGKYAFADNKINVLSFQGSDVIIDEYAFRDNKIKSLNTDSIKDIYKGAFANNKITELTLSKVELIDEFAFYQNELIEVSLNNTTVKKGAFRGNNRFVKIISNTEDMIEKDISDEYGHIVNPAVVTVRFVDDNGKEIASSIKMGEDLTKLGEVFQVGQETTYDVPKISGYMNYEDKISIKPDSTDYTVDVKYTNEKPVLQVPSSLQFEVGETVNKETLLSKVKAYDAKGGDITSNVSVSSDNIDASVEGKYTVKYSLVDEIGNKTEKDVTVNIVKQSWKPEDFTYKKSDGMTYVTGFSKSGIEKNKTNKDLVIPEFDKDGNVVEVIGRHAFSKKGLTSVVFPKTLKIIENGDSRVNSGAFENNQLTSLNLSDLPNLTTIGEKAFVDNQLKSLKLNNLPELTTIESSAFSHNQLEILELINLPKLTTIAGFGGNKLQTLKLNDLLQLTTIESYAFRGNQIQFLELSDLPNLTTIGEKAFFENKISSVNLSNLPNLTTIGKRAFSYNQINSLDLSDLPNLKTIGDDAFERNQIQSLELSNLPELTTIGNSAFNRNQIQSLDLSNLPNLKTIGDDAFSGNKGMSEYNNLVVAWADDITYNAIIDNKIRVGNDWIVNPVLREKEFIPYTDEDFVIKDGEIEGFTAKGVQKLIDNKYKLVVDGQYISNQLINIGESVFRNNQIQTLELSNLPSLTTIGNNAFERNQIKSLELSNLPELTTIKRSAFYKNQIQSLNLSDLPKLTTIEYYAFSDNQIQTLELVNLPNLTTIDDSAFESNQLTSLELTNLPNLTTIGVQAFERNQITSLELSNLPNLTTIEKEAFYKNQIQSLNLSDLPELTDIGSASFKYNQFQSLELSNLPKLKTYSRSYISSNINEVSYEQKISKDITPEELNNIIKNNATINYFENLKQTVFYTENKESTDKSIITETDKYIINPVKVKVILKNQGKTLKEFTDIRSINNKDVWFNKYYKMYSGYIKGNTDINKIDEYNYELTINYEGITEEEKEKQQSLKGFTDKINLAHKTVDKIYTIGEEMRSDLTFDLSGFDTNLEDYVIEMTFDKSYFNKNDIRLPRSNLIKETEVTDNKIKLTLNRTQGGTSLSYPIVWRFKEFVTPKNTPIPIETVIKDKSGKIVGKTDLTYFKGIYENPILKKTAGNSYDNNYYTDNETVDYEFKIRNLKRNISSYTLTDIIPTYTTKDLKTEKAVFDPEENKGWTQDGDKLIFKKDSETVNIPKLKLHFPNIKEGSRVDNSAEITLTQKNKSMYEEELVAYANTYHYIYFTRPVSEGWYGVDKSSYYKNFYDIQSEREKDFLWSISYRVKEGDNLFIEDKDLDERMYYSGLSNLPRNNTVKAYKEDTLIEEYLNQGSIDFTSKEITRFTVEIPEKEASFTVKTKLKDPNINVDENNPFFKNTAHFVVKNKDEVISETDVTGIIKAVELKQTIKAFKHTVKNEDFVFNNDTLTYKVGFDRISKYLLDTLQNVEVIDLLPKGMTPSEVNLKVDSTYEIIPNYNNTGRYAVVIKVPEIKPDDRARYNIAEIKVDVDPVIKEGEAENELYVNVSNEDIYKDNEVKNILSSFKGYSKATDTKQVIRVKELVARKYIKKDTDTLWSQTGIFTDSNEKFQYKLSIMNGTDKDRYNNTIVDVLPYVNDTATIENESGVRVKRGSEFKNKFDYKKGITVPNGYDVYYTEDNINNITGKFDDYEKNIKWSKTPTKNTTAFKVMAKEGVSIKANSTLDIIVPMIAPENDDYSLSGKRAYNTYVRKDDITNNFIEPNRVYNEMAHPRSNITISKKGYKLDHKGNKTENLIDLQDAVFELRDTDNNFVGRYTSDKNGVINIKDIIANKDYILTETQAPEGYKKSLQKTRISKDDLMKDNLSIELINEPVIPRKFGNISFKKFAYDNKPLQGVEFVLTDKNNKDNQYKRVSDENGNVVFSNIPEGVYTLTETQYNALRPMSSKTITIDRPNQNIDLNNIINDKANVNINKISVDDISKRLNQYTKDDGKGLGGARFVVTNMSTNKEFDSFKTSTYSSRLGQYEITYLKVNTLYKLSETEAPDGYDKMKDVLFKVTRDGYIIDENNERLNLNYTNELVLPNKKTDLYNKININKTDQYNEPISNTEFNVYRTVNNNRSLYKTVKTDNEGKINLTDVPYGNYEIIESKPANGHVNNNETHKIYFERFESNEETVNITNNKADFRLRKQATLGRGISEDRMRLFRQTHNPDIINKLDNGTYDVIKTLSDVPFNIYDMNDNLIETVRTDNKGYLNLTHNLYDMSKQYKFKEVEVPNGYKNNNKVWMIDFNKNKDGVITFSFENTPILNKLIVSNYGKDKEKLPNSIFELRRRLDDGSIIILRGKTDNKGYTIFDFLPDGLYKLIQTFTEGHILDDKPRDVDFDGTIRIRDEIYRNPINEREYKVKKNFQINNQDIDKVKAEDYYTIRVKSDNNTGIKTDVVFKDVEGNTLETSTTDDNGYFITNNKYDLTKEYVFEVNGTEVKTEKVGADITTPDYIKFTIKGNNGYTKDFVLSKENNWESNITLPIKDENNENHAFTITEEENNDYQMKDFNINNNEINITNNKNINIQNKGYEAEFNFVPNTGIKSFK